MKFKIILGIIISTLSLTNTISVYAEESDEIITIEQEEDVITDNIIENDENLLSNEILEFNEIDILEDPAFKADLEASGVIIEEPIKIYTQSELAEMYGMAEEDCNYSSLNVKVSLDKAIMDECNEVKIIYIYEDTGEEMVIKVNYMNMYQDICTLSLGKYTIKDVIPIGFKGEYTWDGPNEFTLNATTSVTNKFTIHTNKPVVKESPVQEQEVVETVKNKTNVLRFIIVGIFAICVGGFIFYKKVLRNRFIDED